MFVEEGIQWVLCQTDFTSLSRGDVFSDASYYYEWAVFIRQKKAWKTLLKGVIEQRSWIWILMKIFHYLPLLHAHSTTNKVSQSISSTLLAHMWLSSYTHWTATFSLGICAGWSHNAMLSQQVPQDLILGLPVFHLSNTDNTVVMY